MRTIGITGGTGFVGRHVTKLLRDAGNHVIIFTRKPEKRKDKDGITYCYWSPHENKCDLTCIQQIDAMVHLAGEGLADKRWTSKRKQEIVKSRVEGTRFLVDKLREHAPKCKVFISASAIGYYGPDRNNKQPFHEEDQPANDFLGNTCVKWEEAAQQAAQFVRTVILRFGIVLGKEDGAFKQFARPVKFGVKPVLGSGRQVISWIHIADLARLIYHSIKTEELKGIYNAVTPAPVTNKTLMKTIAREQGGIAIPAPVPAFALKIMLGELSTEVLKSCTVSAEKVNATGFNFQYPEITGAVKQLLQS